MSFPRFLHCFRRAFSCPASTDSRSYSYSARFRSHLASNQVPFKSTIYPEWYQGRIQPWVHYVPVRIDYADVYNLLAFFDGGMDEERTGNHDDLAEEIANAGAEWARSHWRDIDMQACELQFPS